MSVATRIAGRGARFGWKEVKGWAIIFARAGGRFNEHEGWVLSGYIAYAGLLAVFPFLIFASSLAAETVGPTELEALIDLLFEVAPPEVAEGIGPILREILGRDHGGILQISAVGALWAASNGVEAFRVGFDRAYVTPAPRGFVLRRIIGMAVVVGGAIAGMVLGFAVVLAPLTFKLAASLGIEMPFGINVLRYLLAGVTVTMFLYLMHYALPSRARSDRVMWPGIAWTLVMWTLAASGFSIFLAQSPGFSVTYGALSGVIVTLLFFFVSGAVILFGAELNAALEHKRRSEMAAELWEDRRRRRGRRKRDGRGSAAEAPAPA